MTSSLTWACSSSAPACLYCQLSDNSIKAKLALASAELGTAQLQLASKIYCEGSVQINCISSISPFLPTQLIMTIADSILTQWTPWLRKLLNC